MKSHIIPCLLFNTEAQEASKYYCEIFANSFIISVDDNVTTFSVNRREYRALNGGSKKINQSVSFTVYCGSDNEIDRLYAILRKDGKTIMELGPYPWARKYAWVEDKFGVSWQLDVDPINNPQNIVPSIMFVNDKAKMVKQAIEFYHRIFVSSRLLMEKPYPPDAHLPERTVQFAQHKINGNIFNFMSSHMKHDWNINEGISFGIQSESQVEIDTLSKELLEDGGELLKSGWVADKYGITWQILRET